MTVGGKRNYGLFMLFVMMSLLAGVTTFAAFAITPWRQIRHRLLRSGTHRATLDRESRPRPASPAAPHPRTTSRVVGTHPVLSDRLMDQPTGRLHPSTRHRVPPWVTTPDDSTTW